MKFAIEMVKHTHVVVEAEDEAMARSLAVDLDIAYEWVKEQPQIVKVEVLDEEGA
jgi:hypothetical protein